MLQKFEGALQGAPTLPQKDGELERLERQAQLGISRQIYAYAAGSGLPMPMAVKGAAALQAAEIIDWVEGWLANQARILADIEIWKAETSGQSGFSTLADYTRLFTIFDVPGVVETWQDDRIFGSQRLAGLNPMAINLVTADGAGAGISWGELEPKLSPKIRDGYEVQGKSVYEWFREGRLYVTDFASLQGVIPGDEFQMAPIALYFKPDDFPGLLPIGIQLTQNPADSLVYLAPQASSPTQDFQWLMAKTYLQCADLNQNQAVNHLALTHLIEVALALSTHRRLALQHPLFRLLTKHFTALMVINEIGTLTLTNPGGLIDQTLDVHLQGALKLISNAYASWTFEDLGLPGNLDRRGVADPEKLPYYPYRDDGLVIWNRLGMYVREYLGLYYLGDDDVVGDYELQDWARQLSGGLEDGAGRLPGFPAEIRTREELGDIVQRIIWTAGPQHAAVNFPQTEFTNFVPNAPGSMPAPAQGTVTESVLVGLLPGRDQAAAQFKISYALAGYRYDQLLDYHLSSEDASEGVVRKYYAQLTTEDRDTVVRRNEERAKHPGLLVYPYFLPENIPNSTSV